ncbi:MAG: hypothetical protein LBT47_12315 [Deltaproteobacteria bacterium]|nr:hypothetical protein [Deltaproteobacteria bacterium]
MSQVTSSDTFILMAKFFGRARSSRPTQLKLFKQLFWAFIHADQGVIRVWRLHVPLQDILHSRHEVGIALVGIDLSFCDKGLRVDLSQVFRMVSGETCSPFRWKQNFGSTFGVTNDWPRLPSHRWPILSKGQRFRRA